MTKRIMVIAAHPDDEVLGCGGAISKHVRDNDAYITILFMTNGRDELMNKIQVGDSLHEYGDGNITVHFLNYDDNKMDSGTLLSVVKDVEWYIDIHKPTTIYTHHIGDLNIDHQITARAVLTACRPINCSVKRLLSFYVPSSTEWAYGQFHYFKPNVFIELSETDIINKRNAMEAYESEAREYPHPRSHIGIDTNAQYWGMQAGLEFAEPFELIFERG